MYLQDSKYKSKFALTRCMQYKYENRQSRIDGGIEDGVEAMEAHWFGEGVGDDGLEESEDGGCRHLSPLLYVVQNLKHRNGKKTKNCTICITM